MSGPSSLKFKIAPRALIRGFNVASNLVHDGEFLPGEGRVRVYRVLL